MTQKTLGEDLAAWLSAARQQARAIDDAARLRHVGVVDHVGDGVATVSGLPSARLDFSAGGSRAEVGGFVAELDHAAWEGTSTSARRLRAWSRPPGRRIPDDT